jgi:hypothetical protein
MPQCFVHKSGRARVSHLQRLIFGRAQPFVNACLLLNVARAAKVSWVYFFALITVAKQQHSTISAAAGQTQ